MMVLHIGRLGHRSNLSHLQQWQRSSRRNRQNLLLFQDQEDVRNSRTC